MNVLSNDFDAEGDPLTVNSALVSEPSNGVAVVQNGKECSADWIACWLPSKGSVPPLTTVAALSLTPSPLTLCTRPDGTILYTPNSSFSGQDSFVYEISDGQGGTATATVTVTVGSQANSNPVANDDAASASYETPVTVAVLTNDSDADGDSLSVAPTLVSGPSSGTATVNNGKPALVDWR